VGGRGGRTGGDVRFTISSLPGRMHLESVSHASRSHRDIGTIAAQRNTVKKEAAMTSVLLLLTLSIILERPLEIFVRRETDRNAGVLYLGLLCAVLTAQGVTKKLSRKRVHKNREKNEKYLANLWIFGKFSTKIWL